MTARAGLSEHYVPWRVLMLTPSGHVEVVEVRSPTESLALDTARFWKPYHRVATDPHGNPLIDGGPRGRPLGMQSAQAGTALSATGSRNPEEFDIEAPRRVSGQGVCLTRRLAAAAQHAA